MKQSDNPNRRWIQISSTTLNPPLIICLNNHSTVASLKETIYAKHPQHPLPKDQLLVFRSNVLLDSDMVLKILEQTDNKTLSTFHLVVTHSLADSISSAKSVYTSVPSNNSALTPVILPATTNQFVLSTTPPASLPGAAYHVVAINGQFYLVPVLVPTLYPETGPASFPMASNHPQATHGRTRLSWILKLAFVLFIVYYDASLGQILFFLFLSLVFKLYQTGRLRFVTHRAPLENTPPGSNDTTQDHWHQQQGTLLQQSILLVPQADPASSSYSHGANQPELDPNQAQTATATTTTMQPTATASASGTQIAIPSLPTTTPQERQSLPDPERLPNSITITTRWSVLKQAVFTFIASLWPRYNRGDSLTGAAQN